MDPLILSLMICIALSSDVHKIAGQEQYCGVAQKIWFLSTLQIGWCTKFGHIGTY